MIPLTHKALLKKCRKYYKYSLKTDVQSKSDIEKYSNALCESIEDYLDQNPDATDREIHDTFFESRHSIDKKTDWVFKIIFVLVLAFLITVSVFVFLKNTIPVGNDFNSAPTYYME